MARILSTATAIPAHEATRADFEELFARLVPSETWSRRRTGELFQGTRIERRFSALPLEEVLRPRSLTRSNQEYRRHAIVLAERVARECLERAGTLASEVDLVIVASCTGILLPSLDVYLANELGFRSDVRRLPLTELGCAGGAVALSRAHDYTAAFADAKVLVLAVELPTLCFQSRDSSVSNLVASAIFGDGAAAALVTGDGAGTGAGVRILETLSHLTPGSADALRFDLLDDGFHAVLSEELPRLIQEGIRGLVDDLAGRGGITREQIKWFLFHAGGKKILAYLEEELGLGREVTEASWSVLRDYGNQSSASVFFVLHRWLNNAMRPGSGEYGLMAAFGPGLSTEMLLLQCD